MPAEFKVRRNASRPDRYTVSGTLPTGNAFSMSVEPWHGRRCTDVSRVDVHLDVDAINPTIQPGDDREAAFTTAFFQADKVTDDLEAAIEPGLRKISDERGSSAEAVQEALKHALSVAMGRPVPEADIAQAISADDEAFRERREDYLRPIAIAEAQAIDEYETGMRF